MTKTTNLKAVIYCRVSSTKQTTQGSGLDSQETRCREYARYRGHDVVKVFKDDASGSLVTRPAMQSMLAFLKSRRKETTVVIIDDISRLARGLEAHLKLRAAISAVGGILESPSIEFGEDSDSQLVENLLASVSQHQRQKNGEQTKNRMRARTMNGYWAFYPPVGYRFERVAGHGKLLVRAEPVASIVAEALNGFATGRFGSQAEVQRFFESQPQFPKAKNGGITIQRVSEILNQPIYAGHIEVAKWDISLRKGQHEGLISLETYIEIQERLNGKARLPVRQNVNADFPLRGFVTCGDCNHPLTANWSKGRHTHYPYYICRTKGCASTGKSIPRAKVENDFEQVLRCLAPSQDLIALASHIFRDLWDQRVASENAAKHSMKAELSQIDRKLNQLLDRIVDADSETVIKAYEKRVQEFESQKLLLSEKIANCGRPLPDYDETFRTAMEFLASPCKLWASERLEDRRAVLKLAFADNMAYVPKKGFRTAEFSLPFRALQDFSGSKREMVHPTGFEPVASAFGVMGYVTIRDRTGVALAKFPSPFLDGRPSLTSTPRRGPHSANLHYEVCRMFWRRTDYDRLRLLRDVGQAGGATAIDRHCRRCVGAGFAGTAAAPIVGPRRQGRQGGTAPSAGGAALLHGVAIAGGMALWAIRHLPIG
jgi:site-specific DNA recombinase